MHLFFPQVHMGLKANASEQKTALNKKRGELEPARKKIEKAKKDMVEYKKDIRNRVSVGYQALKSVK